MKKNVYTAAGILVAALAMGAILPAQAQDEQTEEKKIVIRTRTTNTVELDDKVVEFNIRKGENGIEATITRTAEDGTLETITRHFDSHEAMLEDPDFGPHAHPQGTVMHRSGGGHNMVFVHTDEEGEGKHVVMHMKDVEIMHEDDGTIHFKLKTTDEDGEPVMIERTFESTEELMADEEIAQYIQSIQVLKGGHGMFFGDGTHSLDTEDGEVKVWITDGDTEIHSDDVHFVGEEGEHVKVIRINGEDIEWNGEELDLDMDVDVEVSDEDGEVRIIKVRIESNEIFIEKLTEEDDALFEKLDLQNDKNWEPEGLNFYPNPTEGEFTLSFNTGEAGDVAVKIYDLNGREVYTKSVASRTGQFSDQIDLSGEEKGVYVISVSQNGNATARKLIIQ